MNMKTNYLIIKWFILSFSIFIASYLLSGVTIESFLIALLAALVLGLINLTLKPLLILLTLPINILTLGIFTLVINAGLIMLAAWLVSGFEIASFWSAIWLSILVAILSWILYSFLKEKNS